MTTHFIYRPPYGATLATYIYTLLKIFKGSYFQSHIFGNILGKILPDCSPVYLILSLDNAVVAEKNAKTLFFT